MFRELTGLYSILLNPDFTLEVIKISMIEKRIKTEAEKRRPEKPGEKKPERRRRNLSESRTPLQLVAGIKRIPQRMCVGCREMKDKPALIRVVRAPDGTVSLDAGGRKPGRGVYLCRDAECMRKALKQKQIERQLEVKLSDELAAELQKLMESLPEAPQDE